MPLSTDVKLPRDYVAKFPDACVGCGGETYRHSIKIATRNVGWHNLFWFVPGSRACVHAPACEGCALRMRIQRWGSGFATILLIALCAFFIFPQLENIANPYRRWVMIGVGLLCISPVILWEIFWPPVFDISATKKSISYEFRDPRSAIEFAGLNDEAEWVEVE